MEDDFGMPPFPDDLGVDWPGWARPGRLSTRLGTSPFGGGLRTGFPARHSTGGPALYTSRYGEPSPRSSPTTTGGEPWKVCVNVHSFQPEELHVKTRDGFVEVSECSGRKPGQFFNPAVLLNVLVPSDVDPLTVFASLSPEGVLIIEARQTPPYYLFSSEDSQGAEAHETETAIPKEAPAV
ncbi:hypothetical protein XENOCAPTIV_025074 [Xenoophorus captivus]|uniref:SHSP domain-containing protein n=1 Tax=Xenoophorus captivus TaxID=1517983 RepID=A0ABV0SDT0_9TELE